MANLHVAPSSFWLLATSSNLMASHPIAMASNLGDSSYFDLDLVPQLCPHEAVTVGNDIL